MVVAACTLLAWGATPAVAWPPSPAPEPPATGPAVGAATQPAGDVADLVEQLLDYPWTKKTIAQLSAPERRADARRLLLAALRDVTKPPLARGHAVAAAVGVFGADAADVALEAAADASAEVRWWALRAIAYDIKPRTPALRRAVRDALRDPSPRVVAQALDAVSADPDPDPEAAPAVLALLKNPPAITNEDGPTRTQYHSGDFAGRTTRPVFDEALQAIGRLGFAEAVPTLLDIARSDSAAERTHAAGALARCAPKAAPRMRAEADAALRRLLADPNSAVRVEAARALAALGDAAGAGVLLWDLRRGVFAQHGSLRYVHLQWTVIALEQLTGQDFGGSRQDDFWRVRHDGTDRPGPDKDHLAEVRARVGPIEPAVRARGLAADGDGFPALPTRLAAADRAAFDRAFANWLTDPRGGRRARFTARQRTAWGETKDVERVGWLFPATDGKPGEPAKPARAVFDDGEELPAPAKYEDADLAADAAKQIEAARRGIEGSVDPVDAACLCRLGREDLAAQLLFLVRGNGDALTVDLDRPPASGAWRAFADGVHAYMVRADDEALVHLERLARLYPDHVDAFGPGAALLADLKRRKAEGTFGKPPGPPPDGFDDWPADKKVARLVHDLEDVDARQRGQPGGVDLSDDPRVKKLIDLGEAAVPALIDCIEKDKRLTRTVHFWRDFAQSRGVIAVREPALVAVMSILGTSLFEPIATGDNFTNRGEDAAGETARRLRAYWDRYGKLPYDRRMMALLTDPAAKPDAALEAAYNLAHLGEKRTIGTMVWTGGVAERRAGPSPVIARFNAPTVAEAALAAYDRHIASLAGKKDAGQDRAGAEHGWDDVFMTLGDGRIAAELSRRFDAAGGPGVLAVDATHERLRWAVVCFVLNDPGPLRQMAAEFQFGTLALPPADPDETSAVSQPPARMLEAVIDKFERAGTDYCDAALWAVVEPRHPFHALCRDAVRESLTGYRGDSQRTWFGHPFFVPLLRADLDQVEPTGTTYKIEDDRLITEGGGGWGCQGIPDLLADPAARRPTAPGRACDPAATKLADCLFGAPAYHPLLTDADARLAALRQYVDRYGRQLRRATAPERKVLGENHYGPLFLPDLPPLGRPATAADVAAGRAVFELGGKGRVVADLGLPAVARLKWDGGGDKAPWVLVVQAERVEDGRVRYGTIGRRAVRAVDADECAEVKRLADVKLP